MLTEEKGKRQLAAVDFVRHNPQGLAVMEISLARSVIHDLFNQKQMTVEEIIGHSRYASSPDELLVSLAKLCRGTAQWGEFLDCLCRIPKDWWREYFLPEERIAEILKDDDLPQLVSSPSFRKLVCRDHPLIKFINFDPYWERRVRWFIVTKSFRRAWAELNKARKGFPNEQFLGFSPAHQQQLIETGQFYAYHHGGASTLSLIQLIDELFQVMAAARLVRGITRAELTRLDQSPKRVVYEIVAHLVGRGHRKPRAYTVQAKPPGYCFAQFFLTRAAQQFTPGGNLVCYRRAAMALQIARYFSDQRNLVRRAQHEQALVAYQRGFSA